MRGTKDNALQREHIARTFQKLRRLRASAVAEEEGRRRQLLRDLSPLWGGSYAVYRGEQDYNDRWRRNDPVATFSRIDDARAYLAYLKVAGHPNATLRESDAGELINAALHKLILGDIATVDEMAAQRIWEAYRIDVNGTHGNELDEENDNNDEG